MKVSTFATIAVLVAGCTGAYAAAHMNLTAKNGMTLYTFDKDMVGASLCYDECAVQWPPFVAENGTDMPGLSAIERRDGRKQWAKDGKPLYFWIGDTEPGEANGDGAGGVWHIARP
ncbi:hypothetical protein HPDFL43_10142 [Hoeflea phototrophica DFL-43]|uniref:Lipoprotein n=1 Tax=Hoeflea phototrophica (strain DSM 17068 / NCIMB 14078 / DFL-43) TaxID=411684 RepID=A9D6T2_HOEPD|nr:hypothetical protein [Hoeflea phototrophica]EDQ33589.2 hypothetical protein HPDFL43_10142 [Hoeflea phototrophica DFL-43]